MRARRHAVIPAILILALVVTGLTMTGPSAVADPARAQPPRPTQDQRITLITGDRVELTRGVVRLVPGPGREGIGFAETTAEDGRYTVIPADALPLVGAGRLDPRLFDVSLLLRAGYDDARRPELPLIAGYADTRSEQRISAAGARITRALPSIRGGAILARKSRATTFWNEFKVGRAGIDQLRLDGPVQASLEQSVPQIGAPTAWQNGFTGQGVKVAVLDTGIDPTHPDLDDAVLEAKDFSDSGSPIDHAGHGSHVSSIITGSGDASDGRYRGVAPDAGLLVGKVLGDDGSGSESGVIAGMDWAVGEGARIVNLSLGGCATDGTDPLSQAVDALTERHGTLFVVAAGNHPAKPESCFDDERISSPAAADRALAVASVTKHEQLSSFSNVGPRIGDHALKPEISAPGEEIVAARASQPGGDPTEPYVSSSGTSMAAPHVAGAAAILAQQHPDWRAAELRSALMAAANPNPGLGVFQQGAGRVDLAAAIKQQVLPEPAGLSFGLAEWPHTDDDPSGKRLTYRNTRTTPVTLDLAVAGDAPAGLFTVSPARLTVPAGQTASVTVTADTRVPSADGLFGAWVTASAGGKPVARTPVGVTKEAESYDLTIKALDRAGKPAATPVHLIRPADREVRSTYLDGKSFTVRLPAGTYDLTAPIQTDQAEPAAATLTLVARPELKLTRDTVVVLDARAGRKVRARVDSRTAKPSGTDAVWIDIGSQLARIRGGGESSADLFVTPTRRVRSYPYAFGYTGSLAEPATTGRAPLGYVLYRTVDRRIPQPTLRFRDSELATVRTHLHGEGVELDRPGRLAVAAAAGARAVPLEVAVPGERVDHYSAGADLEWLTDLETEQTFENDFDDGSGVSYRPGRTYDRHWGRAAIGPAMMSDFSSGRLWMVSRLFSSSAAGQHTGLMSFDGVTARNTLRKEGVVIQSNEDPGGGEFANVDPTEAATYRLSTQATRAVDWSTLATRIDASWTFRGPFEDFSRISSLTVRVAGDFDRLNRAPAGQPFPLGVTFENATGTKPEVQRVRLAASFDDGTTWSPLPLVRDGAGYRATVPKPPADARFVSLRSSAMAADGTAVEQTVIRSYALAR